MLDQNTFTETVREVSEIIRTASEPLSEEEILGYFAKMELNETQKKMVLEYLLKPQAGADSQTEEETGTEEEKKADMELPDSQALRMYMEEIEGLSVCAQEELQALYEKLLNGDATVIEKISESWMGRILEQAEKTVGCSGGFFGCCAGGQYGPVHEALRVMRQWCKGWPQFRSGRKFGCGQGNVCRLCGKGSHSCCENGYESLYSGAYRRR